MLTQEQCQELSKIYQLAAEAVQSGRELEYRTKGHSDDSWETVHHMLDNEGTVVLQYEYRLKTEPKLRPWTPNEVPVGALIRCKGTVGSILILAATENHTIIVPSLSTGGHVNAEWPNSSVLNNEYSTDQGKTWQPCGVLVDMMKF